MIPPHEEIWRHVVRLEQMLEALSARDSAAGEVTGVIKMHGSSTPPSGYLLCDGAAVSRTTYANLFDVIGTAFGVGDGSTTFNVPDIQRRIPIGWESGDTVGGKGG